MSATDAINSNTFHMENCTNGHWRLRQAGVTYKIIFIYIFIWYVHHICNNKFFFFDVREDCRTSEARLPTVISEYHTISDEWTNDFNIKWFQTTTAMNVSVSNVHISCASYRINEHNGLVVLADACHNKQQINLIAKRIWFQNWDVRPFIVRCASEYTYFWNGTPESFDNWRLYYCVSKQSTHSRLSVVGIQRKTTKRKEMFMLRKWNRKRKWNLKRKRVDKNCVDTGHV